MNDISGTIGTVNYKTSRLIPTGRIFVWSEPDYDPGFGAKMGRTGRVISDRNGYNCSCGEWKRSGNCDHVDDVFGTLEPLTEKDYY